MRARDLGLTVGGGEPGRHNAITDVLGVRVGHSTVIRADAIRTGVTVVLPLAPTEPLWRPVFAGVHRLNGNGELTGLEWIRDSGTLGTPVALTNTYSVGTIRDALIRTVCGGEGAPSWVLPVVGETYDGILNAIEQTVIGPGNLAEAIDGATDGKVAEGCVGAGTGTICHGFKGGIGTASRRAGDFTVGVLVQTNHGRRERLCVCGVQVGEAMPSSLAPVPAMCQGSGSIIVVIATDAPLLPHQCTALARRASLGIGRVGGTGETESGDLLLAFATGNLLATDSEPAQAIRMLPNQRLDPLYDGVIAATEEAIVNSLVGATTTRGRHGTVAYAIDHQRLVELIRSRTCN